MLKNFIKFSAIALGIIVLGLVMFYLLNYWQSNF